MFGVPRTRMMHDCPIRMGVGVKPWCATETWAVDQGKARDVTAVTSPGPERSFSTSATGATSPDFGKCGTVVIGSGLEHRINNTLFVRSQRLQLQINALQPSSALSFYVQDLIPRAVLQGGAKKADCYQKTVAGIQYHWIFRTRALECVIGGINRVPNARIISTSHLKRSKSRSHVLSEKDQAKAGRSYISQAEPLQQIGPRTPEKKTGTEFNVIGVVTEDSCTCRNASIR
jgi:hypothetical protein